MRFGAAGDRVLSLPNWVPKLNDKNPLARNIRWCSLPVTGINSIDIVRGYRGTIIGNWTLAASTEGIAWYAAATTDGLDVAHPSGEISQPVAMGVVFIPTSTGAIGNLLTLQRSVTVAANNAVGLRVNAAGNLSSFSTNNSGTLATSDTTNTVKVNEINVAAGNFSSATFRQGALNGKISVANTTSNIPSARDTLSMGSGKGTTRSAGQPGYYLLRVVWRRNLTASDLISFTLDPWQIFLPPPAAGFLLGPPAGSGGSTFTFGVSGQIVLSGTQALLRERQQAVSGLITLSGNSPLIRDRLQPVSGQLVFSGAEALKKTRIQLVSGSIVFSGAVTINHERTQVPIGSIAFTGAVPLIRTRLAAPTGTIVFSGSSGITFIGSNASYTFAVSGSIAFTGFAAQLRSRQFTPSGSINFSGAVTALKVRAFSVSGNLLFSGAAALRRTRVTSPSGQVTFSGNSGMTFIPFGTPTTATISKISIGVNRTNRLS